MKGGEKMCKYFNLYDADKAEKNLQNIHKYGTANPEEIQRIEEYAQKVREEKQEEAVDAKIAEALPEIQERERNNAIQQAKAKASQDRGEEIFKLSPFNCVTISVNGEELNQNHFFPTNPVNDPLGDELVLYFDDINERWLVRHHNGIPKIVSRFVIDGCLIINASAPGVCDAYVVFQKGEKKPLVFWNGIIDPAELRRQTQFHKKGLSYARKDLYQESFMRALALCKRVYFLTFPKHPG